MMPRTVLSATHYIKLICLKGAYVLLFILVCNFASSQNNVDLENPFMADPTVFFHNGVYYLYGTGGGNKDDGFKVFTSTDKTEWVHKGYVLKKGETFGTKGFWAPQVFEYNHKFYMAYTANEHIAIAAADSPLGPFKQIKKDSLASSTRMIDPYVFFNAGKIYLYHVRLDNGNRIFVAEMNKNLTAIDSTTLKECIHSSEKWEDTQNVPWKVAEGPTVLKHQNQFYLIFSANDFRNPDYAVGYATASNPVGPWKKFEGNPIISRNLLGINGTGHGDVFHAKNGGWWYVFHTHFSDTRVAKRRTAMIQIAFEKTRNGPDRIVMIPKSFQLLKTNK